MRNICKRVHDLNGKEVTADTIVKRCIEHFEKGSTMTLRNESYTFWAEVECKKQLNNRYWFTSLTYGWDYIVNLNNNTVLRYEK